MGKAPTVPMPIATTRLAAVAEEVAPTMRPARLLYLRAAQHLPLRFHGQKQLVLVVEIRPHTRFIRGIPLRVRMS